MNTQKNKQLIRDYLELFARDRDEAVDRYVSDPNLREHIIVFSQGLPGYQLHEDDLIAEGDSVVLRCQIVGTHQGDLLGHAATGNNVNVSAIIIYRVENERITKFWAEADMLGLFQQIGAIPAPADA